MFFKKKSAGLCAQAKENAAAEQPAEPIKSPAPKWHRIVWNVFTTAVVVVFALLAAALVGVRLFGYTPYAVLTGSMSPAYNAGDLVYVKKADPADIKIGDVVTYIADEKLTLVTHRVFEKDDANGCLYTQGDRNDSRDSAVLYENVVGKVEFSIPKLGYVSSYISSESGRYVCICAALVLILLLLIPEFFKKGKK